MSFQSVKFYQTGTYTVGNRLLTPKSIVEGNLHDQGVVLVKFG
ncbi:MAG: hypothetical protein WAO71_06600 [Gallionella sp.]